LEGQLKLLNGQRIDGNELVWLSLDDRWFDCWWKMKIETSSRNCLTSSTSPFLNFPVNLSINQSKKKNLSICPIHLF